MTASSPISRALRACVFGVIAFGLSPESQAVPAFARQTDLDCTACHVSWPELTPTGRQFKLNGYTLGDRQTVPLAGMLQISRTSTKSVDASAPDQFPKDRDVVVQQASLFAAGKITDHLGAFTQWTYDGVAHHSGIDNVDIRYALHFGEGDHKLITGVTLNNNPTVQDVYNTVPAWGFPFASSPVAVTPNATTIIDGALSQQVAGLGVYALWNSLVYGEITAYRTAGPGASAAGLDRPGNGAPGTAGMRYSRTISSGGACLARRG